jgi:SNF2-related domain
VTMTAIDWAPLAEAIQAIAGACDGARTDDGCGFNAGDVPLGHYLAKIPAGLWDDDLATAAHQLARVYKAQLLAAGIEFEDLPAPDESEREVRDTLTERRRAAAEAARVAEQSFCFTAADDGREVIVLGFPYEADMVAESRSIPGRRFRDSFAGRSKVNTFPVSSAAAVAEFCATHSIPVDPAVELLAALPQPEIEEPTEPNITFLTKRTLAIRFDTFPSPAVLAAVKSLPGRKWDKPRGVWTVPVSALADVAFVAEELGLRLADDLVELVAGAAARAEYNLRVSVALTPDGPAVEVPGLAGMLKPHQLAGLEFIAANRRVLIGDKMGLGKSLLSLAAVAVDGAWPAVIVCKTSLRLNWLAEMAKFFPARTVFVASGNAPQPIPDGTDVVVIGFDVLKETYKTKIDGVSEIRPGWLPALVALDPRALIVDESHFGKEAAAARSQAMETLGAHVASLDGLVECLSGTAVVNRPKELLQQLKIMGRLDDMGGEWPFRYRYCGPQTNDFGTTFDGATNLTELHLKLRSTGVYLRRGDDALNLPPLTIRPDWLGEDAVDFQGLAAYRSAEEDFLAALVALAAERGVDLSDPEARAEFCRRALNAEVLVRLNLLRQLVGRLKTAPVTAAVLALVAAGEKVMVAAHHRLIVDHYASTFTGLRIQGGQSTESVEADKAAFQCAPVAEAPVISVSTQAGGVGHTLTAAAFGVMAEVPWTWAEIEQMAGREHRIGQTRPVDFAVMLAEQTVDEYMWQVVSGKRSITAAVLDGVEAEPESENAAAAEVMDLMLAKTTA